MTEEELIFTCAQCPKMFATRSNLKRHMENPNIHNIPYARSRDQKRWKGHSKKVSSRAETTERMRKWRAENRDKNKKNDLRCRVYRLARQKYGEEDTEEKQKFINEEINRRLGRRMLLEQSKSNQDKEQAAALGLASLSSGSGQNSPSNSSNGEIFEEEEEELNELPFYCAPLHKIELPSLDNSTNVRCMKTTAPATAKTTVPSNYKTASQPPSPIDSNSNRSTSPPPCSSPTATVQQIAPQLPPMQSLLTHLSPPAQQRNYHS